MLEFFKQWTTGPAILGKKLPSLRNPPSETPLPNAQELKSTRSQLWGDVQLSSVWDPATKKPNMEGVVVIPLFYVDFSAEQAQPEPAKPQKREKKAESDEEEDEGFTLKKGTGRKRKVSDAGLEQQQQQEERPVSKREKRATTAPPLTGKEVRKAVGGFVLDSPYH